GEVQWRQEIGRGFHDYSSASDANIRCAVFHVRCDVDRLHQDCAESFVLGFEYKLPRIRDVLRKADAGLFQCCQRRFQKAAFAKCDYKHSFTALPDLRSSSAFSKPLSTLTGRVSVPAVFK